MAYYHFNTASYAFEAPFVTPPHLLYTGVVVDDPKWFNIDHLHPFCELLYVMDGIGHITVNGATRTVQMGDLIVFNPLVRHRESSDSKDALHMLFLAFDSFSVPFLPENHLIQPSASPFIQTGDSQELISRLFAGLVRETECRGIQYCTIAQEMLNLLVLIILRLSTKSDAVPLKSREDECALIKDYIDHHYMEAITLESLAKTFFVSKYYLSHMFKEMTATSPIRYLTEQRIREASQKLASSSYSIKEIARLAGYSNEVYFAQVFHKETGMTPAAYRRKMQK